MTVAVDAAGAAVFRHDAAALDRADAAALAARFACFARASWDPDQEPSRRRQCSIRKNWSACSTPGTTPRPGPPVSRACTGSLRRGGGARDRVALRCGGHERTHAALAEEVERLAGLLHARVRAGDRVGVCTCARLRDGDAALAAQRCGAAYVPLDPTTRATASPSWRPTPSLAALVVDGGRGRGAEVLCPIIDLEADRAAIAAAAPPAEDPATGEDLAYMTATRRDGRPKGVMVRTETLRTLRRHDGLLGGEAAGRGSR